MMVQNIWSWFLYWNGELTNLIFTLLFPKNLLLFWVVDGLSYVLSSLVVSFYLFFKN